jgi:hypothetical protein
VEGGEEELRQGAEKKWKSHREKMKNLHRMPDVLIVFFLSPLLCQPEVGKIRADEGKNKLKTKRRRRRRQTSSFGGHRSDFLPAKFITFLSFKRVGNIASAIMEMEPAVFTSRLLPRSQ